MPSPGHHSCSRSCRDFPTFQTERLCWHRTCDLRVPETCYWGCREQCILMCGWRFRPDSGVCATLQLAALDQNMGIPIGLTRAARSCTDQAHSLENLSSHCRCSTIGRRTWIGCPSSLRRPFNAQLKSACLPAMAKVHCASV